MAIAKHAANTDPKRTIELLDALVDLGFSDDEFREIHHFSDDTINKHRSYCRQLSTGFQAGGANSRVQARLALVLQAYQKGGFSSDIYRKSVLMALAKAAVAEVPK